MEVIHLISGPIDDNTYIAFDKHKNSVIIDAPFDCVAKIKTAIEKYDLNAPSYIFITHTHWDHIGGLAELKCAYPDAKICVHQDDSFRLEQAKANLGGMEITIEPVAPEIIFTADITVTCGDMVFDVLHTPGHSPGAVCYSNSNAKILFSGDTLFRLSIGRTDFPGSDYATLIGSIRTKLWQLSDDTIVYCGHNDSTTIGYERKNNPFLTIQK